MTLEEAKKILKDEEYLNCLSDRMPIGEVTQFEKAIDTVLKALEDSIPKDKVREKIEQLTENDNLVVNEKWDSVDVVCAKREEMAQVDILQELLGE